MRRHQWRYPALVMFSVGYGANQFVPLLVYYRRSLSLSDAAATAIFGTYALGLIPSLLVAGRVSDRRGRRPVVLLAAVLSLAASLLLITGRWGPAGLYAGRALTGVVSGTAFSAGTAWVKELSAQDPAGAGARRAALALTAGFGIGPLVAGPLAQWAPAPDVLPYVVHIVLAAIALALVLPAAETHSRATASPTVPPSLRSRTFQRTIAPLGPWVFGSATLIFTTLPAHAGPRLPGLAIAFPGFLAAFGLSAGVAIQPAARRASSKPVALGLVALGCAGAAAATARPGLAAIVFATAVLGIGYGMCIVVGLRAIEDLAGEDELGSMVAVFYSLAYSGLAIPYLLALAAPRIGYPRGLLIAAGVAALCGVLVSTGTVRREAGPDRLPLHEGEGAGPVGTQDDGL